MSENPICFISYSWTTPEHEEWVLALAKELVANGVDVRLDKWLLREGHDSNHFMEQISDPAVTKVILVCDRGYVLKANGRTGGVGTESQIVTPEIFKGPQQDKYVAVLAEREADGSALLPTYYGSRLYIDLSDAISYGQNLQQLLRWVYGQPENVRPALGKRPAFLDEKAEPQIAVVGHQRAAIELLRKADKNAAPIVADYLAELVQTINAMTLVKTAAAEHDDEVVLSIERFRPRLEEFLQVVRTAAKMRVAISDELHSFFESVAALQFGKQGASWQDGEFDNIRVVCRELFLFTLASYLKSGQYELFESLVKHMYLVRNIDHSGKSEMSDFRVFGQHTPSLEYRVRRLQLSRFSLVADILVKDAEHHGLSIHDVALADFCLWLRNVCSPDPGWRGWAPLTCIFFGEHNSFEFFTRAEQASFRESLRAVLGVADRSQINFGIEEAISNGRLLSGGFYRLPAKHYANVDNIGRYS